MVRKMKILLINVISKIQQSIMKNYGHFDEEGFYVIDKPIPTAVASLIRKLGKWLVALGNCSPQQKSIIEKHYKQHQLTEQKVNSRGQVAN